ncbi:MAG: ABC transporter ATP-binding protein [Fibrobacteria bacterium]|nr:ABC transporter ATP-binding protein [Fibrobacteria bacterium]
MSLNSTLLKLQGVGYAYEAGNTAVFGVDMAINAGEILLVTGANGAGKTSLLKLIGGFLLASEGRISFDGADMVDIPESRLDEWVAFVRTEGEKALVGPTVEDELARACRMNGLSGAAIPERVGQALSAVQLSGAKSWYLDEMSMGERRRVALAAALIGRPRMVILDEPLSDLDAQGVKVVDRILHDLARRGLAIVFSSHHLDPAVALADRLVVLDQGGVVADGAPSKVLGDIDLLQAAGLPLPPGVDLVLRLQARGLVRVDKLPVSSEEAVEILLTQLS